MNEGEKKGGWKQKLHDKYKLTIMNKAFEEKFSLELSKFNVFIILSFSILLLIILTTLLIAFTPLKEYIPGYGSTKQHRKMYRLEVQLDSLKQKMEAYELYTSNLQQVFISEDFNSDTNAFHQEKRNVDKANTFAFSKQDSALLSIALARQEETPVKFTRIKQTDKKNRQLFFQPVDGTVQKNPLPQQASVNFLTFRKQPIYAITDGCVIMTAPDKTICIQHPDNTVSIYRQCGELLVHPNEFVHGGQVIAQTAQDSAITCFELWINGKAVQPTNYFTFQ